MNRLHARIAKLESGVARRLPGRPMILVGQYEGTTPEQAIERWEAENGPVGDRDVVLLCGVPV